MKHTKELSSMTGKWRSLTNDELRQAISDIVDRCTTEEQVNATAREELEYPYFILVYYGPPNKNGKHLSQFVAHYKDHNIMK